MVIIMKPGASTAEIAGVISRIESMSLTSHPIYGEERTVIAVVGNDRPVEKSLFETMAGVDFIQPILKPFKLASREFRKNDSAVPIIGSNGTAVNVGGDKRIVLIAGPCACESRSQVLESAWAVKEAGARAFRGGAYKPRTSPYSFQGHGEEALKWMAEAREVTGLAIVTEVMAPEQVELVSKYANVLQIGARNMQNYALLNAVGESMRPVLLKRGMSATMEELLMAAEYILSRGNYNVMLCERGIRTFETYTRNTLDINAVPVLKRMSHLPVVVDPSHATGKSEYVLAAARAGIAAGADGLIIEVHPDPSKAMSDGAQSLTPTAFHDLVKQARRIAEAMDREI
ncbi:MAG TPA: 3-deoxy-7-phosphoheptulonate synthase [Thermoflexales bacterium]|nr:3-deoxy-7-phosphoheptulonate synthase [Thermoflexales bacterium]HRA52139.1 3-deoxy-7-phosphoheptulonate synthase [Thermoflexales bacterium]